MAKTIPDARLVTIPLAAHCPQYENADVWREAIDCATRTRTCAANEGTIRRA